MSRAPLTSPPQKGLMMGRKRKQAPLGGAGRVWGGGVGGRGEGLGWGGGVEGLAATKGNARAASKAAGRIGRAWHTGRKRVVSIGVMLPSEMSSSGLDL